MDARYRRSGRLLVIAGVTSTLVGFALLSDSFSAFRTEPRPQPLSGRAAELHATLNGLEERLPAGRRDPDARWRRYLAKVDHDLNAQDVSAAIRAWHDAQAAALESRRWEAMLEVGDAALEIGRASGSRAPSRVTARDAYLIALIRARREGSLEGTMRVADAFGALSDHAAVRQSLRVADRLAVQRRDAAGAERVRQRLAQLDEPIVSTTEP
jgi:hypothetical protein